MSKDCLENYEVLEQAIPRGKSDAVAKHLHGGVTGNVVRRWRQEPVDEAPLSSGQRSPLDRFVELHDAVFLENPLGTGLIINHVNQHHLRRLHLHTPHLVTPEVARATAAGILTEATKAVNSMTLDGCTKDTLQQLLLLREVVERALETACHGLKPDETTYYSN